MIRNEGEMGLNDVSVSKRLIVGFLCIVLLMAGLAGFSITQVGSINDAMIQVNDINIVKQRQAINFRGSVHDRAIALRDVVILSDKNDIEKELELIQKLADDYAIAHEKLTTLLSEFESSDEEMRIFEAINEIESETVPQRNQVIEMKLSGNQYGSRDLLVEMRDNYSEWLSTINQFIDYQEALNNEITDSTRSVASGHKYIMLGLFVVSLVISAVAASWSIVSVKPLTKLAYVTRKLADDDLNVEIPEPKGNDEVGQLIKSIRVFKENAYERKRLSEENEREQAAKKAQEEKEVALTRMADDFESSVKKMVNSVTDASGILSKRAHHVLDLISSNTDKTKGANEAAEATASIVQTVASAAEELSSSIKSVAFQITKTKDLVEKSNAKAKNIDSDAQELMLASDRVSEAMKMISSISSKINLLALNATIESARAGEAGKGFAVVAAEVKSLAGQTDSMVSEINNVVDDMRNASKTIINSLTEIGNDVSNISEATTSVASAVEQQSATTSDIAANIQTASQNTSLISQSLDDILSASKTALDASSQMKEQTDSLSETSSKLDEEVNGFLSRVKNPKV